MLMKGVPTGPPKVEKEKEEEDNLLPVVLGSMVVGNMEVVLEVPKDTIVASRSTLGDSRIYQRRCGGHSLFHPYPLRPTPIRNCKFS